MSTLLFLLAAFGQADSERLVRRFDSLDRNRDAVVTREETGNAPWFDRLLGRLDRNRDGRLQRSEVSVPRGQPAPWPVPAELAHRAFRNVPYSRVEGVAPNLLSLDLYVPVDSNSDGMRKRPVVVMIHGGGWRGGDKSSPAIVGTKMRHFVGRGSVYVTVNYRLSPAEPTKDGLKHPVHVEDCAKAIAWLHDHVAEYCGNPGDIHVMGHSAGGHLAALVTTNDRFLRAEEKSLDVVKSVVLLDPAAIDVPGYLDSVEGRGMTALYDLAFGRDPASRQDASPQQHVAPDKSIPPTILFYAGDRMALDRFGPAFAKSLREAGTPARAIDTVDLDHGQVNRHVGLVGEPMTTLIDRLHAGEDPSRFANRLESPPAKPAD